MNSQRVSIDQLVNLIKSLDEVDKIRVRSALDEDFDLSAQGLDELLKRKAAFKEGKLSSKPWNEIKKDFGSV